MLCDTRVFIYGTDNQLFQTFHKERNCRCDKMQCNEIAVKMEFEHFQIWNKPKNNKFGWHVIIQGT